MLATTARLVRSVSSRTSCRGMSNSGGAPVFEFSPPDFVHCTNGWGDSSPNLSEFDKALMRSWDEAMAGGLFRYDLQHVRMKILPGNLAYVAQLNTKRATERRKPEEMHSLNQPFDASKFNFTKLPLQEILYELRRRQQQDQLLQQHQHIAQDSVQTEDHHPKTSGYPCSLEPSTEKRQIVSDEHTKIVQPGHPRHLLAINVSPLEYGHVLLIPDVDACCNQNLTLNGVSLAIDLMLLSAHRGFRVGFNSLCAYASVNHQHLHGYYLDRELYVETAAAKQLCPGFYEMVSTPTTGFGFQLKGSCRTRLDRMIFFATDYLRKHEIAHCIFITRGQCFDAAENGETAGTSTVRIILWPRQSVFGAKPSDAAFSSAVVELAGHLLIKDSTLYETMTEEYASSVLREASLSPEHFERVRNDLVDAYSVMNFE